MQQSNLALAGALAGRPHRRLRPKPIKCPPTPLTPRHAAQPYLRNLCLLGALMNRSSKQAPPSPEPAPFVALISRCRFPPQRLWPRESPLPRQSRRVPDARQGRARLLALTPTASFSP
ncbi:hypothetical protein NDU88_006099 [Pleurodeles waltl]|uniref:Uncharacterized protein n=1 Tax=Pleurodeles waltl TaxID=8319 RepID=A0AAV7WDQ2_PLEWA|nr:hypothetical protein NDU88_006099 [Pleurodeles waltl]